MSSCRQTGMSVNRESSNWVWATWEDTLLFNYTAMCRHNIYASKPYAKNAINYNTISICCGLWGYVKRDTKPLHVSLHGFTVLQPNNFPTLNFNDNLKFITSLSIKNHFNNKIFTQVHYYLIIYWLYVRIW